MRQSDTKLILGEFRRVLDDRYRLSIPNELVERWGLGPSDELPATRGEELGAAARPGSPGETRNDRTEAAVSAREFQTAGDRAAEQAEGPGPTGGAEKFEGVLAKERPGCLSLWRGGDWQEYLTAGIRVVESKLQAGRLGDRLAQVQTFGRLLSTRHRTVQLAGRGRLVIPEGFREFLGAEPGTEVLVVGAAVCIEIWQLEAWRSCLNDEIPRFSSLLDELSG